MKNKATHNNRIMTNYYWIENVIELKDVLSNLDILYKNGILMLYGIPNYEIVKKLESYEVNKILDAPYSKIFSFSIFPPKKIKLYDISIRYTEKSKEVLVNLADEYVPYPEFCTSLFYADENAKLLLEWNSVKEESEIYLSIDFPEKIIRKFCKSIYVDSFCTKFCDIQTINNGGQKE
jgi:hypothetical protein